MATEDEQSGIRMAEALILQAANSLYNEIVMMEPVGSQVKLFNEQDCSRCEYSTLITNGNVGVIVNNLLASKFKVMTIPRITIKSNFDGPANLIVNDGVNPITYSVVLSAGTTYQYQLGASFAPYSTTEKSVKIYLEDANIGLYNLNCPTLSSCGSCSKRNGSVAAPKKFSIQGLNSGNPSTMQYGIIPCVTVSCTSENLICNMLPMYSNLFAQWMAYDVAINVYKRALLSTYKNDVTLNLDPEVLKTNINTLSGMKDDLLNGRKAAYNLNATTGIKTALQSFLNIADECVECKSPTSKRTATF